MLFRKGKKGFGTAQDRGNIGIIACESGKPFARGVCFYLDRIFRKEKAKNTARLIPSSESVFANTEVKTEINESIRDKDIFIIQDVNNSRTGYSVDTNLRALKTAIDSAWRSDANYITAVLPVFPYARQDRPVGRECITAAQVAAEIEAAGADRVITLDIHNRAISGFFRKAILENLHASKNIMKFVARNIGTGNLVVLAPDEGGVKRASYYAQRLKAGLGIMYKKRDYSKVNVVSNTNLLGEVDGKDVLIVDDMVDTAGTLVSAVEMLRKEHNPKRIFFACSLPILSGPAVQRLSEAYSKGIINGVITTDAVYHGGKDFLAANPWCMNVTVADYFARVIYNINHYKSISELLK